MSPAKDMYKVVSNPIKFTEFIKAMKDARVVSKKDNLVKFYQRSDLPLLGSFSFTSLYLYKPPKFIFQKAISGDITKGRWIWHFENINESQSLAAYSFYMDIRQISWILRVLFSVDPTLEQGSSLGGGLAILKKMYNQAKKKN